MSSMPTTNSPPSVDPTELSSSVSVVMAVYNGARFLAAQLDSVLSQLHDDDELIVIDDGSTDETQAIFMALNDPRVNYFRHERNQGVRKAFELGLQKATRPIVFLCDQDDVWLKGKRIAFVTAFEAQPRVAVVVSDAQVIDDNGRLTAASFMASKGGFRGSFLATLIQNRYLGCSMALRRHVLDRALPLPPDIPMHDMWLGSIASLIGDVVYLDTPYLQYRRHAGNLSPSRRQSLATMLRWRLHLLLAVSMRMLPSRFAQR